MHLYVEQDSTKRRYDLLVYSLQLFVHYLAYHVQFQILNLLMFRR